MNSPVEPLNGKNEEVKLRVAKRNHDNVEARRNVDRQNPNRPNQPNPNRDQNRTPNPHQRQSDTSTVTNLETGSSKSNSDVVSNAMSFRPRKKPKNWFARISFFIVFVVPMTIVAAYYAFVASNQYRVDSQFSVRGITQSPFADLGILALPGASSQSGDSYIVTDYIQSSQMIYDLRDTLNIDLRSFFSTDIVDPWYRISADMPVEEFQKYWANQINIGFNSTTGNTELQVFAFSAEDAKFISDQILILSEKLVNELSNKSRDQLIQASKQEVVRTEERLTEIRRKLLVFRDREQAFDPAQVADLQIGIVKELQGQLTLLQTKKLTIGGSIRSDSPALRVIDNQISALKAQIADQLAKIGSGNEADNLGNASLNGDGDQVRNLSQVLDEYSELKLEQEFATTAFTTALAALEKADAQALQQQRYFATYVFPRAPEIALYPMRLLNTFVAAFWLLCLWAAIFFIGRSVRDHAI